MAKAPPAFADEASEDNRDLVLEDHRNLVAATTTATERTSATEDKK